MANALTKYVIVDTSNQNRVSGVILDEEAARKQANELNDKLNENKADGTAPKNRFIVKEHLVEG
jgi:hypothetical protein